jgi:hypothetical protein
VSELFDIVPGPKINHKNVVVMVDIHISLEGASLELMCPLTYLPRAYVLLAPNFRPPASLPSIYRRSKKNITGIFIRLPVKLIHEYCNAKPRNTGKCIILPLSECCWLSLLDTDSESIQVASHSAGKAMPRRRTAKKKRPIPR